MAKVFISYRRDDPDQILATHLRNELENSGHDVFLDVDISIGQRWAEKIQAELTQSDYFIILVSEQSMDRDMVRQEMQQVHTHNKKYGSPVVLPVRLGYLGPLPYDMAAWIDPLQYAVWNGDADNQAIVDQLLEAMKGATPLPHQKTQTTADQATLISNTEVAGKPLPTAEPVLDVIALSPDNPFYVERQVDTFFYESLRWDNGVATLHAPSQMGKSSLLAKVRAKLEQDGMKSAFIDLKMLAAEGLEDNSSAFEGIAYLISDQLSIDEDPASYFSGRGFVGTKLQKFLTLAVAPVAERVVLLFDDIDSIFDAPYRDAFFGCLRAAIDQKAMNPALQRIGFGFAHSHDPGLWITSASQSPFNVATQFLLPEFNRNEFEWLHTQHHSPLNESDINCDALYSMLGGHPYLTRLALFRISKEHLTFEELVVEAATDEGVFGDHLRARLMSVINAGLSSALKSILDQGICSDIKDFQRLLAMGLVKGESHKNATARFGLYRDYFKPRLDA